MEGRAPLVEVGGSRIGFHRVFSGAFPLLLAAVVSACGPVADTDAAIAASGDRTLDPEERVFSTARLVEVSVEMDPDDLYEMRREGRSFSVLAEGC